MSSYQCYFNFRGQETSVFMKECGLADFADGFWVDENIEPINLGGRGAMWIPPGQITLVEKLDLIEP